jgi:hypothetical protein
MASFERSGMMERRREERREDVFQVMGRREEACQKADYTVKYSESILYEALIVLL